MGGNLLHQFVAVRDARTFQFKRIVDPFFPAYSEGRSPTQFIATMTSALSDGDIQSAISSAADFEPRVQLGKNDILDTAENNQLPPVENLPVIARTSNEPAMKALIRQHLDLAEQPSAAVLNKAINSLSDDRDRIADIYCSAVFAGSNNTTNIDSLGFVLACYESIERFLRWSRAFGAPPAGQIVAPGHWTTPILAGRIVLPLGGYFQNRTSFDKSSPGSGYIPAYFIGDLVLIREHIRRYERGEIAHVENILRSETYERNYRLLSRTEVRLIEEVESEREISRDSQTTTRDSLENEIQKDQSETTNISVGWDIGVKYSGPAIEVIGNARGDVGYSRTTTDHSSTASKHSQEVVQKAAERLKTRTLQRRESFAVQEKEDQTKHSFDNKKGKADIVGIYQWLTKISDVHVINYGRRLMFEFMVPEPSEFWWRMLRYGSPETRIEKPEFPKIVIQDASSAPPSRDIRVEDFSLRPGSSPVLDVPTAWPQLVAAAVKLGVSLADPPAVQVVKTTALAQQPAQDKPEEPEFGMSAEIGTVGGEFHGPPYNSAWVSTLTPTEKITIPEGYECPEAHAAVAGWAYIKKGLTFYRMHSGKVVLQVGGVSKEFTGAGNFGAPTSSVSGDGFNLAKSDSYSFSPPLSGDVAISLGTSVKGTIANLAFDCHRTARAEAKWARECFEKIAKAYSDEMASYEEQVRDQKRSVTTWDAGTPPAQLRTIIRTELKRSIINIMLRNRLGYLGATVVLGNQSLPPSPPPPSQPPPPSPALPDLSNSPPSPALPDLSRLPEYERVVTFFEKVFDWTNIAYIFGEYFYARQSEWPDLSLASTEDAAFQDFLRAGAARVQVPVQLGAENHALYFFAGCGSMSPSDRIPTLSGHRPIAEDLAAASREGFAPGPGHLSVTAGSPQAAFLDSAIFTDPADIGRELRINNRIYLIKQINLPATGPRTIVLDRNYAGTTNASAAYEIGGLVIGPSFEVKVPTTLIALMSAKIELPTFAGRYE
jgi:hypothetical protein